MQPSLPSTFQPPTSVLSKIVHMSPNSLISTHVSRYHYMIHHHIRRTSPPTKPTTPTINRGNNLLLPEVVTTTGEFEIAAAIPAAGVVGAQGQSVYVVVLSTRVLVTDPDVMVVRTGPFVEVAAST